MKKITQGLLCSHFTKIGFLIKKKKQHYISLKAKSPCIYIKCWIIFAGYSFGSEPYLEPQEQLLNMREKKVPSVSDDGTTFEDYLNGKFVSRKCK